ncbi:hypothetical protein [Acholeplasma hippikon]|uniref:hypothetical protein n=1 Tax=Acholeplasma hippikon TaxID=264636 RepID=UPI0012EB07D2|nr:hypothetical protein [Acholeplasma hippikon]
MIKWISKGFEIIFNFIVKYIKIIIKSILKVFEVLWLYLLDYLTYYYIVLLSPIILIVLAVMFVFTLIYLLPIYLYIAVKSLFGKKVLSPNEIIYVKEPYEPIKYLINNIKSFTLTLKYKYVFSAKFKSAWLLVKILTWQLVYGMFLFLLTAIIYLPFSLLSLVVYKDKHLDNKIILKSRVSNGLMMLKPIRLFNKSLTYEVFGAYLDEETKQLVLPKTTETSVFVKVLYDDKVTKEISIQIKRSEKADYLYHFNELKNEILKNKTYQVKLPVLVSDELNVKYENIWQRDKLNDNTLIVRSVVRKTDIKLILENKDKKAVFEQNIELRGLINPTKVRRLNGKPLILKNQEKIYKYLPKGYCYNFYDNPYLNHEGSIKIKDDISFMLPISIEGINEIYHLNIKHRASRKVLKSYIKELKTDLINDNKMGVNFKDIKREDGSIKSVQWCIDGKRQYGLLNKEELYRKIKQKKKTILTASFEFNGKKIDKKIKIYNEVDKKTLYNEKLNVFLGKYFNVVDKENNIYKIKNIYQVLNRKYIKLPTFVMGNILAIRLVTLDKELKNSGLILDEKRASFYLKTIVYENIFKRRVIHITLLNGKQLSKDNEE